MVGTISVKETAKNSNFPLPPIYTFTSAPSHVRLIDVPKQLGAWKITSISVDVVYPDGTSKTSPCTLVGGCWSTTFDGCGEVGKVVNGATIKADGIDELGNAVSGYVLGKGDVIVLDGSMDVQPDQEQAAFVRLYSEAPDDPKAGALADINGWMVYTLSGWQSLGSTLTNEQLSAISLTVKEMQTLVKYDPDPDQPPTSFSVFGEFSQSSVPNLQDAFSAELGSGVTSISPSAFQYCETLYEVTVPDSVISIGDSAFQHCYATLTFKGREQFEIEAMDGYPWGHEGTIRTWNAASQEWVDSYVTGKGYTTSNVVSSMMSVKQDKLTYEQNAAISSVIDENVTKLKFETTAEYGQGSGSIFSASKADESESIVIDWGDGTVQRYVDAATLYNVSHSWATAGTHWVKVYNVNSIIVKALYNNSPNIYTLKEVQLGDSITNLRYDAFSNCSSLSSIVFKDKTLAQVQAMSDYPWSRESIITTWNAASQEWVQQQIGDINTALEEIVG